MIDQNNVDTDNIHLKNSAASTQDQKGTSNKESEIFIIGDSLIKHIDPQKISKRKVTKRTFPSKTANEISSEVKSIKLDSQPSHIIVHAGTNDIPVDSPGNCIKNVQKLALCIKEKFPGARIGILSITARYESIFPNESP